jgi:hypothetical protein
MNDFEQGEQESLLGKPRDYEDKQNEQSELLSDIEIALEKEKEAAEVNTSSTSVTNNLIATVQSRYEQAQRSRDVDELRWLGAYQNYRGLYAKNVQFRENEKSRVFIKVTKTKVVAAYGQLLDILFGTGKFPISINATEVPEGSVSYAHFSAEAAPEGGEAPVDSLDTVIPDLDVEGMGVGYKGDGQEIKPGARWNDVVQGIKSALTSGHEEKFREGPANKGEPQFKPAHAAANRMEKLIHDQISESKGERELKKSLFECCLLGEGIIKGPFTEHKTLHRWTVNPETKERVHKPETVKVPRIEHVSVWDAFPDPNATNMQECEWFIQRHKLSRSSLRKLKSRPFFDDKAINEVLKMAPNYINEDFENSVRSENTDNYSSQDRYEVLEMWGVMDRADLVEAQVISELNEEIDYTEEVQVNVWVCGSKLLRVVLNPFTPARIPYQSFSYEENPYSFFGIGVAENMSDCQQIMNGHMRMAIDNLALAGNVLLDVDENALAPGQSMEVYPGKIFKRQGGQPGQAIYGIKFPNTAPENMQIFDKFRQIADESTNIPSYAHGQTGVMSTTRTASGMSMLMGAATLATKTVISNLDTDLLMPLGEAMFQWNMNFYEGELEIVGDLEIKPGGAASLMQNEVKSQRLTGFGQLMSNPLIAPYIKVPAYVKAFSESLELEPEELLNDDDEARAQAEIMGTAAAAGAPAAPPGMPGAPPQQTGQVGAVPPPAVPGGPGFAANTGQLPPELGEVG